MLRSEADYFEEELSGFEPQCARLVREAAALLDIVVRRLKQAEDSVAGELEEQASVSRN